MFRAFENVDPEKIPQWSELKLNENAIAYAQRDKRYGKPGQIHPEQEALGFTRELLDETHERQRVWIEDCMNRRWMTWSYIVVEAFLLGKLEGAAEVQNAENRPALPKPKQTEIYTLDSRDVAVMVGKSHNDLMKDIRRYSEHLGQGNFSHSDYFIESTYKSEQNKTMPCYRVTRKGCEMIANKMTGQKGVLFTAAYIERFHEMEGALALTAPKPARTPAGLPKPRLSEINNAARIIAKALKETGAKPEDISNAIQKLYLPVGIELPVTAKLFAGNEGA